MQLLQWATLTPNFAMPPKHVHIVESTRRVVPLWCSLSPNNKRVRRVALHQRGGYPLVETLAEQLGLLLLAIPRGRVVPHTLVGNEHVRLRAHRLASRHLQHYVMTVDTTRQNVPVLRAELP